MQTDALFERELWARDLWARDLRWLIKMAPAFRAKASTTSG